MRFYVRRIKNTMRTFLHILPLVALLTSNCAPPPQANSSSPHSGVVGTWKWISIDDRKVPEQFHVRYYTDGTAATWPAPEGWSTTTNGVSHGRYHLDGEYLVLETGRGKDDPKTKLEIRGDRMILVTDESIRLIYRRIVPDIEPGK